MLNKIYLHFRSIDAPTPRFDVFCIFCVPKFRFISKSKSNLTVFLPDSFGIGFRQGKSAKFFCATYTKNRANFLRFRQPSKTPFFTFSSLFHAVWRGFCKACGVAPWGGLSANRAVSRCVAAFSANRTVSRRVAGFLQTVRCRAVGGFRKPFDTRAGSADVKQTPPCRRLYIPDPRSLSERSTASPPTLPSLCRFSAAISSFPYGSYPRRFSRPTHI